MKLFLLCFILTISLCHGQAVRILFDATKAEMAGNADWVIDADVYNLGNNFNGAMVTGQGSDANPQRVPTPSQLNITSTTTETFWDGALSNWATDLVKLGYEVQSLPFNDSITYGNSSHGLDLSNFKVFIIDEPNILFSASEKIALVNFVANGGGLFIISDHDVSDRNGDGYDSPSIWNDLFANNGIQQNPFGISFDLSNFSQTSSNLANLPADSCLHGVLGDVTAVRFSNGTTMTLDTAVNASVRGLIYKTGSSNSGQTNALFVKARYGNGKVCSLGDSSPPDDGTGDPNDFLYFSYTGEANGSHRKLLVNSVVWLATDNTTTVNEINVGKLFMNVYPNPCEKNFSVSLLSDKTQKVTLEIFDIAGRKISDKRVSIFTSLASNEELILPSGGSYKLVVTGDGILMTRSVISY